MDVFSVVADIPHWVFAVLAIPVGLYLYGTWYLDYFEKMGIKGPKPKAFLGTMHLAKEMGWKSLDAHCFKTYGKVFGLFEAARTPVLSISDPDLVKEIAIKQSHIFLDRNVLLTDPLTKDFLMNLKGDAWRNVRNTISPTFTSGKLKKMMSQINECCGVLTSHITEEVENGRDVDAREFIGAYVLDVIASTGFGIQIDSQKDKNCDFVKYAEKGFKFTLGYKIIFLLIFPELRRFFEFLGIKLFPQDSVRFFSQVTSAVLKQREETRDKNRTDFIQLMANAHNMGDEDNDDTGTDGATTQPQNKKGLTENEILASSVFFFLAGYETTTSTTTILLYNLGLYQDIQEKVIEEIDSVMADKDEVTYQAIQEMPYLDMVLNETMRLYPAAFRTDRVCDQDFEINGMKIKKGTVIGIGMNNLHHDPDTWPDPLKFDPERFTEEEKAKRKPYTFIPFGLGPRLCIGMRLAQLEMKCATVNILRKYKITISDKTETPLKLGSSGILRPETPIMLYFHKREKQ